MYQYKGLEDTITAVATAIGQASIAIIRLSGKNALTIVDQMFVSKRRKDLKTAKSFSVHYGWIVIKSTVHSPQSTEDSGLSTVDQIVDEVLVTVMRAPKTYTCEDMVEISCHGGLTAVNAVLNLAIDLGARLAEPGEFTKRAFLNGRIDLTQAEAVLDIVHSKTDAFLKVCTHQLKGDLSKTLEHIREMLMNVYTEIEAILNFPEDDIDVQRKGKIKERLTQTLKEVDDLLLSSGQGKILREGIKIVLCGRPNVGKSSLLNVLLKQSRAIVSDIAGTTRDTIEEMAQIKGIPFQLIDTAGILKPRDAIEEEAVSRSKSAIASAELILFILDGSQRLTDEDHILAQSLSHNNVLFVINKSDLPKKIDENYIARIYPNRKMIKISALNKQGLEDLENTIVEHVWKGHTPESGYVLINNARHIESLKRCQQALLSASTSFDKNISLEFISEEIKSAVNGLDAITGKNIDEDLLETIFSQFCIGK